MTISRSVGNKIRVSVGVFLLAILWSTELAANNPEGFVAGFDVKYSARIDWIRGVLHLAIDAPLDISDKRNQAGLIGRKEHQVRALFPSLFPIALRDLRVNSTTYLSDLIDDRESLAEEFQDEIGHALLLRSQPSRDLSSLRLEYQFSIFPHIAERLVHNQNPLPVPALLDWKPSAPFSGLVIYAKDDLPIYGTQERAKIIPSVFPRIYDQDMRLVVSMDRAVASIINAEGFVRYSTGISLDRSLKDRVGANPMMIAARGLFGSTPTDLLISREDADILLANADTRKALSEGRIAIILPDERAVEILIE